MKRPFAKLKAHLFCNDMSYDYLGKEIGRSASYLSNCLNNKAELKLNEAYAICDVAKIDYASIAEYFPQNGGV